MAPSSGRGAHSTTVSSGSPMACANSAGLLDARVVQGARARAELVFKVGGGDGDAALNFDDALARDSAGRSRVR